MQQKAGRTGAAVEWSHTLLNDADGNLIAALGAWMDMDGEIRHEPSTVCRREAPEVQARGSQYGARNTQFLPLLPRLTYQHTFSS